MVCTRVARDLGPPRTALTFLVWRDLKVRYKQAILGASWYSSAATDDAVFGRFLGKIARFPI